MAWTDIYISPSSPPLAFPSVLVIYSSTLTLSPILDFVKYLGTAALLTLCPTPFQPRITLPALHHDASSIGLNAFTNLHLPRDFARQLSVPLPLNTFS
ncbi:hypothetical protein C8F04DRAFT_1273518 [Mycena alexandri]|uniref:Uncharacterized protein n=1 Tax=Mycena alexandri TaxID=1745969 RepID=A0AAD6S636_9AGAR|nr:hypothetical protein C8F04DRAFT_1273518 [Mycena alexandri]